MGKAVESPDEKTRLSSNMASGEKASRLHRRVRYIGAFLCILFLVSLVIFLTDSSRPQRRILFFTSREQLTDISGEVRFLPRQPNRRDAVEILVRELCLGPRDIDYRRVVPSETRLSSLLLREQTLYLDFEPAILFTEDEVLLSYDEVFSMIEKNVFFNFRSIEEVVITVDGQMPFSPYFGEKLREENPGEPLEG